MVTFYVNRENGANLQSNKRMNSPKRISVSPKLLPMLDYCVVIQLISSIEEFSKPAFPFSKHLKSSAGFNSLYAKNKRAKEDAK